MKHGGGIKGLDDKSSGMEILMTEVFAKIKPTDPLILVRHVARRKRKCPIPSREENESVRIPDDIPDSSGMSLDKADASR